MDKTRLTYLIQKLRSGDIAPEERDELESYWLLAQHDDSRLRTLSGEEKNALRLRIFEGVRARVSEVTPRQTRTLSISSYWMLGIAAAVTLLLVLTIFWTGVNQHENRFRTAYGEQKTIQLPDRSEVVINGNSTIRFADNWEKDGDREVWIDGEAFFDVVHTENHQRFVVHTESGMDVQVLGTKFNVKNRRGKTEVMLQEGRVRLDIAKSELQRTMTLQPGELATLENSELMKVKTKPVLHASWKDHKLFFDQTPLGEIAFILEDTYGIDVEFESEEIADRKLSGEIASEGAEDILRAIQETLDVSITLTITPQGQKAHFHL